MAWASYYIAKLKEGVPVQFRPHGRSMSPLIESGQLCTVEPVDPDTLEQGDIVLCRIRGKSYLHLVLNIHDGKFMIGNNRGHVNGWVDGKMIFGKCVKIEK